MAVESTNVLDMKKSLTSRELQTKEMEWNGLLTWFQNSEGLER